MSDIGPQLEKALAQLLAGIKDGSIPITDDGPPDDQPDANPQIAASAEFAKLSPTARQDYANKQLVDQLRAESENLKGQIEEQQDELRRLQQTEVENARLRYSLKSARWIGAVCVVAMAVGGGLVSSFAPGDMGFGIGWGLLIVAGLVQIGKSLFNW